MNSTRTNQLIDKRIKHHPDFPNHQFYNDGRCQIIRQYINHSSGQTIQSPYFMKFIKQRTHPLYGMLFFDICDNKNKRISIYPHKITAQLFLKKSNDPKKTFVWFKDDNKLNCHYKNLYWVSQGELQFIQERLGTRDMKKQAATMRDRRPKDWFKNSNHGRPLGSIMKGNKVVKPSDIQYPLLKKMQNRKLAFLHEYQLTEASIASLAIKHKIPRHKAYKYINQNK